MVVIVRHEIWLLSNLDLPLDPARRKILETSRSISNVGKGQQKVFAFPAYSCPLAMLDLLAKSPCIVPESVE
jgi:hypothetical protein